MADEELTAERIRESMAAAVVDIMLSSGSLSDDDSAFLNTLLSRQWSSEQYTHRYAQGSAQDLSIETVASLVKKLAAEDNASVAYDIRDFIRTSLNGAVLAAETEDANRRSRSAYYDVLFTMDDEAIDEEVDEDFAEVEEDGAASSR